MSAVGRCTDSRYSVATISACLDINPVGWLYLSIVTSAVFAVLIYRYHFGIHIGTLLLAVLLLPQVHSA